MSPSSHQASANSAIETPAGSEGRPTELGRWPIAKVVVSLCVVIVSVYTLALSGCAFGPRIGPSDILKLEMSTRGFYHPPRITVSDPDRIRAIADVLKRARPWPVPHVVPVIRRGGVEIWYRDGSGASVAFVWEDVLWAPPFGQYVLDRPHSYIFWLAGGRSGVGPPPGQNSDPRHMLRPSPTRSRSGMRHSAVVQANGEGADR